MDFSAPSIVRKPTFKNGKQGKDEFIIRTTLHSFVDRPNKTKEEAEHNVLIHEEKDTEISNDLLSLPSFEPTCEQDKEKTKLYQLYQRVSFNLVNMDMLIPLSSSKSVRGNIISQSYMFQSLVILNLQQNAIIDITPLRYISSNIRFINLCHNRITTLPNQEFWESFQSLSILLLSKNLLQGWQDIQGLIKCPRLSWLDIKESPLMEIPNARSFIINELNHLKVLNEYIVTDVEFYRDASKYLIILLFSLRLLFHICIVKEPTRRFAALSEMMKLSHSINVPYLFQNEITALNDVARLEKLITYNHLYNRYAYPK
jgi:hypothetical protein